MGVRIKPVEPTVIKDKKIVQKMIAEIHRKPTLKTMNHIQKRQEILKKAMASE
jgi:hypothetical protein